MAASDGATWRSSTSKSRSTRSTSLKLQLTCDKYFAAGLGKFRIWATNDPKPAAARELPAELEPLVQIPLEKLAPSNEAKLLQYFCSIAPQLSTEQVEIKKLRDQIPKYNTTLVMQERKVDTSARRTFTRGASSSGQPIPLRPSCSPCFRRSPKTRRTIGWCWPGGS